MFALCVRFRARQQQQQQQFLLFPLSPLQPPGCFPLHNQMYPVSLGTCIFLSRLQCERGPAVPVSPKFCGADARGTLVPVRPECLSFPIKPAPLSAQVYVTHLSAQTPTVRAGAAPDLCRDHRPLTRPRGVPAEVAYKDAVRQLFCLRLPCLLPCWRPAALPLNALVHLQQVMAVVCQPHWPPLCSSVSKDHAEIRALHRRTVARGWGRGQDHCRRGGGAAAAGGAALWARGV